MDTSNASNASPRLPTPPTEPGAEVEEVQVVEGPTLEPGDEDAKLLARKIAAQSIAPGCSQHVLSTWSPKSEKPRTHDLRAEILNRDPSAKCKNWEAQKCADWLYQVRLLRYLLCLTSLNVACFTELGTSFDIH